MTVAEAYRWLLLSERRKRIISSLTQPCTATQIARRCEIPRDACSDSIARLVRHRLLTCLNPGQRRSRLYWLTNTGKACQKRLFKEQGRAPPEHLFPDVDWALYGWLCFRHRAAIIQAMSQPLQPAVIRRRACFRDPTLRMSANNTRDVMRLLKQKGVVQPLKQGRQVHAKYALGEQGQTYRQLIQRANEFAI